MMDWRWAINRGGLLAVGALGVLGVFAGLAMAAVWCTVLLALAGRC